MKKTREERTLEYLAARARPLQTKTVTYKVMEDKNYGLPPEGEVTLVAGKCPCAVCGHEWMWECEDADCKCCTSVCN